MSPKRKKTTETPSEPSAEVRRLRTMLKAAMKVLGFTNRDVERKLGLSGSYLSRLFSGMIDLKVDHVVAISQVIGLEPEEMFQIAFPKKKKPVSPAALRLKETLEEYQRTGAAPWGGSLNLADLDMEDLEPPAQPKAAADTSSSDLEQVLEKMMAKALHKVLDRMG